MGLHYLTFIENKLENKKKLTPVQIMHSASLKSNNIVAMLCSNSAISAQAGYRWDVFLVPLVLLRNHPDSYHV